MEMIFTEEDLRALFNAICTGIICTNSADSCDKYRDERGFLDCGRCIGGHLQAFIEDKDYDTLKSFITESKIMLERNK